MKLTFINMVLRYLILSIFINTYLCMEDHTKDKVDMANIQGNLNFHQVAVIGAVGAATKEKPLKVDYSKY